jgi:hypothetical protein
MTWTTSLHLLSFKSLIGKTVAWRQQSSVKDHSLDCEEPAVSQSSIKELRLNMSKTENRHFPTEDVQMKIRM